MGKIKLKVDSQKDLTVFTVVGEVDSGEILNEIRKFYEGEVTKYILWDLSESDVSKLTSSDVQKIAFTPPEYSKKRIGGKTAMVAPKNITFGLSRMYEMMKENQNLPFPTMSFRTCKEAYKWLLEKE